MSEANTLSASLPMLPRANRLHAAILARVCAGLRCGSLAVTLPSGRVIRHRAPASGPEAEVVLHRWRCLRRLAFGGDIAFAESFMDGDWSSPDVTALLELAARNIDALDQVMRGSRLTRAINRVLHRLRDNTPAGSRRNIVAHYDLGNDFYARWLDAGMSYSSALYRGAELSLEQAQIAKQDRVLELMQLAPGQRVLEIGIGWGGLAERIARAGATVTGLTLSPAQLDFARARLAGLPVQAELRDYRDEVGHYDRIVSIEMLEAVGEAYWSSYLAKLRQCLAPTGNAVLQVITICEERFEQYRGAADFIQRHIFPGGMLPSPSVLREQIDAAGLKVSLCETFGRDYARTLAEWRRRFELAWPEIAAMGFPPRFRRLWHYYLCYCEAGFRAGVLDVGLWRLEHAG